MKLAFMIEEHPLKAHLKAVNKSPEEFAREIGLFPKSIYRNFSAKSAMSLDVKQRIEIQTKQQVKAGVIAQWEADNIKAKKVTVAS